MTYGVLGALKDVNLEIHEGEFVSISGPSGSGKSTLLAVLGLLERPSVGTYCVNGQDAWRLNDGEQSRLRGETLGFVFQQFHLLPELTALENVARPLRFARVPPTEARARAARLLDRVGLAARAGHRPSQLSGGEQQRVAIARALVRQPRMLLADEPTGNLPQSLWADILDVFTGLNQEGHTIVLVTHDPLVAARASRHVILHDGTITKDTRSSVEAPATLI